MSRSYDIVNGDDNSLLGRVIKEPIYEMWVAAIALNPSCAEMCYHSTAKKLIENGWIDE